MLHSNPHSGYPRLRALTLILAGLALGAALTGIADSGALLAWAVALLALSVFVASFYLKS